MAKRRVIYGIVPMKNGDSKWVPIGAGFENADGSENLLFDFYPARPDIDIQAREPKPREDKGDQSGDDKPSTKPATKRSTKK